MTLGFPAGVIIPIGYFHIEKYRKEIKAIAGAEGFNMYIAKHCDDTRELTHVVPNGFVNRFGAFFTKEKMPEENWCLDVGKGSWFTRKNFATVSDVFEAYDRFNKKKGK